MKQATTHMAIHAEATEYTLCVSLTSVGGGMRPASGSVEFALIMSAKSDGKVEWIGVETARRLLQISQGVRRRSPSPA